ncbi:hypothetical protein BDM02DRAFT_3268107 [Thelephora ganbajun]|uniref:Uncharacterized protein n=1 Tax=Thelephora ganbajun TaxID=370292 RepID=A0ACB6ZK80_THEGA|nr:hypothetical protein BDM02DRAFT_3268107 [Thelephora ganbajun]
MTSYLDYPKLYDIAAQLYADQLSEDQRFHLQIELDDAAIANILALLGQHPDVAEKPHGQARRNYNIQEAAGIDPGVYKVMKNVIRHLCHRHLDTEISFTSQQQRRVNRLRIEAILAFPQLAKHDKQWPATDLVRQYLENSASYRTKKATITLKKRLAATERVVSYGRKNGKRGESSTDDVNVASIHDTLRPAGRRGESNSPPLSTSDHLPSNSRSPRPVDQQPFMQGSSKTYDYGSQFYSGQYTYPPPPPMSDPTATQGWYDGYPYSQTRQDYGTKQIYENHEVYTGSQLSSQLMSAP